MQISSEQETPEESVPCQTSYFTAPEYHEFLDAADANVIETISCECQEHNVASHMCESELCSTAFQTKYLCLKCVEKHKSNSQTEGHKIKPIYWQDHEGDQYISAHSI